jgi:hypothetical protein
MKIKIILITIIAVIAIVLTGCGTSKPIDVGKTIKSTTTGDTTITLSSASGEIKNGENELMLSFADQSGKPVNVPAASLRFYMPAMASMAEMNDAAALTTTETPGIFRARVNIESPGTWEAMISFQRTRGTEQAMMSVNAK